jgi:murein L,D-transpeptidase YafK
MTRKSRKRAAKYSELSRTRKKRQPLRHLPEQQAVPAQPKKEETSVASAEKSPAAKAQPRIQSKATQAQSRMQASYQYVRNDLKRIGMLAGAMIVILIILTFVLG